VSTARPITPVLAWLLAAFLLFVALVQVDQSSGRARYREAQGAVRGAILDRYGRPLVLSVTTSSQTTRIQTIPDLAPAVGYRDDRGRWVGLEAKYSAILDARAAQNDWRTFFLHLRGESVRGGTVRLTLDRNMQLVADRALGKHRGAVVALDPRTGGVLALVSRPFCAANMLATRSGSLRCQQRADRPLLNRATQLLLPPGSAFKIVTLSAAIDTKRFNLGTTFRGADVFGPDPYFDNVTYPSNITRTGLSQLTLAQALAFSDNFTFAHIGLTLGAPTLLHYARRFYLGRRIPFDLPVAVSHVANGRSHPSLSELAQSSFGAETDKVTVLQMALIVAAVANRGVMMAPHLVSSVRSDDGHVFFRYRIHQLSRVMSSRTARQVTQGMTFVVNHGSGYLAAIAGVQVAGKTGTAASGAYYPHAWFISFAPAAHPIVAVAVLKEYSGEGFKYAAPVARAVLVAALRERGYHVR
jgi:penicillin-binding protein A